jgi:hypothetical protein
VWGTVWVCVGNCVGEGEHRMGVAVGCGVWGVGVCGMWILGAGYGVWVGCAMGLWGWVRLLNLIERTTC